MVILLPFIESDRLKNGSIITSKQLLLSCSITYNQPQEQCFEENQGVTCEVNPHLGWEVQSDAPGTTYNGNSTDKIAEQLTLTSSLDNDMFYVPKGLGIERISFNKLTTRQNVQLRPPVTQGNSSLTIH